MEDCSQHLGGKIENAHGQTDTKRGKAEKSNTKQDKENNKEEEDDDDYDSDNNNNNNGSYNGNNKHKQELTNSFEGTLQNLRRRVASVCVAHNSDNDNGQRDNFYTIAPQYHVKTAT